MAARDRVIRTTAALLLAVGVMLAVRWAAEHRFVDPSAATVAAGRAPTPASTEVPVVPVGAPVPTPHYECRHVSTSWLREVTCCSLVRWQVVAPDVPREAAGPAVWELQRWEVPVTCLR